jgi:hypothetical protein
MAKKKQADKHPAAVALAKRRAESLTPAQRTEIARAAAEARWKKPRARKNA